MTKFLTLLTIILFFNFGKEKKIVATYSAISCSCAQWKIDNESENIYLERENKKLKDVNKLWNGKTFPFKVVLKGKFKAKKGIPENFTTKGNPKPAKIFVYSKVDVILN